MADRRRQQHRARARAVDPDLAVRQRSVLERRVDHGSVLPVGERVGFALRHAEAPALGQYDVRYGTRSGCSGSVKTCSRSSSRDSFSSTATLYPSRLSDESRNRARSTPVRCLDPPVSDVPLAWHDPVEHFGAGRRLTTSSGRSRARTARVSLTPSPVGSAGWSRARGSRRAAPRRRGRLRDRARRDRQVAHPPGAAAVDDGALTLAAS